MLVTRIIGSCPQCQTQNSFGNVSIHSNALTRGCGSCSYSQTFLLPELKKTIVYLDQSFLSHAFREELDEFKTCADFIRQIAHDQLLVCPRSSTHKTETMQWRDSRRENLWEFIKRTSRGHEFAPEYRIKQEQILCAFRRFLANDKGAFPIQISDALSHDVNQWEDYFTVEVETVKEDPELTRKAKEDTTSRLPGLFDAWRKHSRAFEEHLLFEYASAAEIYINSFARMATRMKNGDLTALIDSPIDSQIVEVMIRELDEDTDAVASFQKIPDFFKSSFFREVPVEYISCGIVTVLRDCVKMGQYSNPNKAKERLSGFFFDLNYISAYAPYCDAMYIDNEMHQFAKDKRLRISDKFGTKFFSKSNMDEFSTYLESIHTQKNEKLLDAIEMVYPKSTMGAKA